jgi:ribosome biogenesis GTPase A
MELVIEKGSAIKNVQKEFNRIYPYLKIEFFKTKFHSVDRNKLSEVIEPVSKSERFNKPGIINVAGDRTAAQLENDFIETFGLLIKFFRKSGTLWIETTLTESWSLEKQNEEGEFMSVPAAHKNPFANDFEDAWLDRE